MQLAMIGVAVAAFGGVLLATQLPSEAVIYRGLDGKQMVVDESPRAMKKYQIKIWLYRLGILLLIVGSLFQAIDAADVGGISFAVLTTGKEIIMTTGSLLIDGQILANQIICWLNVVAIIAIISIRMAIPSWRTTGIWAVVGLILIVMGIYNVWIFILVGYKSAPLTISALVSVTLATLGLRFFGNWLLEVPQPVEQLTEKERMLEKYLANE